jgi:hypothetical protein
MQKLKKSLENNILRTLFQKSSLIFNLETYFNNNFEGSSFSYETKILTTKSCRQLKFLCYLGLDFFKYPLVLKIFETHKDLNKYFAQLEEINYEKNNIVTKSLNILFKNDCYLIVKYTNICQTFFKLRNTSNLKTKLLLILIPKFS